MNPIQRDIETRLASAMPDVEVLLVEPTQDMLRIFIDHPEGVTLELCEAVTLALGDVRERYGLEVSSPGPQRPLTKPEHFRRFVGRRARVRTAPGCDAVRGESRNLTGELVGASEHEVTLAAPEGVIAIPYDAIQRSHLVEE